VTFASVHEIHGRCPSLFSSRFPTQLHLPGFSADGYLGAKRLKVEDIMLDPTQARRESGYRRRRP